MKFYVSWGDTKYATYEDVLSSEDEVTEFLNKRASNPQFWFRVIHGCEIKFKPVEIATSYVRDRGGN